MKRRIDQKKKEKGINQLEKVFTFRRLMFSEEYSQYQVSRLTFGENNARYSSEKSSR